MDRRGRAGEVVDFVDVDLQRLRHVMAQHLEAWVAAQVRDVLLASGGEIVEAQDPMSQAEKPVAEVRADEACSAGDQNALYPRGSHVILLPTVHYPPPKIERCSSEERREGKGCVTTCRFRWWLDHSRQKNTKMTA